METKMCRSCFGKRETVYHLLAGCKFLPVVSIQKGIGPMVFATEWRKDVGLND